VACGQCEGATAPEQHVVEPKGRPPRTAAPKQPPLTTTTTTTTKTEATTSPTTTKDAEWEKLDKAFNATKDGPAVPAKFNTTAPAAVPAPVVVLTTVENMDPAKLAKHPVLKEETRLSCQVLVALSAGVPKEEVSITFVEAADASSEDGESSVSLLVRRMRAWVSGAGAALTVRAEIRPLSEAEAESVQAKLSKTIATLPTKVVQSLGDLPGIDTVKDDPTVQIAVEKATVAPRKSGATVAPTTAAPTTAAPTTTTTATPTKGAATTAAPANGTATTTTTAAPPTTTVAPSNGTATSATTAAPAACSPHPVQKGDKGSFCYYRARGDAPLQLAKWVQSDGVFLAQACSPGCEDACQRLQQATRSCCGAFGNSAFYEAKCVASDGLNDADFNASAGFGYTHRPDVDKPIGMRQQCSFSGVSYSCPGNWVMER